MRKRDLLRLWTQLRGYFPNIDYTDERAQADFLRYARNVTDHRGVVNLQHDENFEKVVNSLKEIHAGLSTDKADDEDDKGNEFDVTRAPSEAGSLDLPSTSKQNSPVENNLLQASKSKEISKLPGKKSDKEINSSVELPEKNSFSLNSDSPQHFLSYIQQPNLSADSDTASNSSIVSYTKTSRSASYKEILPKLSSNVEAASSSRQKTSSSYTKTSRSALNTDILPKHTSNVDAASSSRQKTSSSYTKTSRSTSYKGILPKLSSNVEAASSSRQKKSSYIKTSRSTSYKEILPKLSLNGEDTSSSRQKTRPCAVSAPLKPCSTKVSKKIKPGNKSQSGATETKTVPSTSTTLPELSTTDSDSVPLIELITSRQKNIYSNKTNKKNKTETKKPTMTQEHREENSARQKIRATKSQSAPLNPTSIDMPEVMQEENAINYSQKLRNRKTTNAAPAYKSRSVKKKGTKHIKYNVLVDIDPYKNIDFVPLQPGKKAHSGENPIGFNAFQIPKQRSLQQTGQVPVDLTFANCRTASRDEILYSENLNMPILDNNNYHSDSVLRGHDPMFNGNLDSDQLTNEDVSNFVNERISNNHKDIVEQKGTASKSMREETHKIFFNDHEELKYKNDCLNSLLTSEIFIQGNDSVVNMNNIVTDDDLPYFGFRYDEQCEPLAEGNITVEKNIGEHDKTLVNGEESIDSQKTVGEEEKNAAEDDSEGEDNSFEKIFTVQKLNLSNNDNNHFNTSKNLAALEDEEAEVMKLDCEVKDNDRKSKSSIESLFMDNYSFESSAASLKINERTSEPDVNNVSINISNYAVGTKKTTTSEVINPLDAWNTEEDVLDYEPFEDDDDDAISITASYNGSDNEFFAEEVTKTNTSTGENENVQNIINEHKSNSSLKRSGNQSTFGKSDGIASFKIPKLNTVTKCNNQIVETERTQNKSIKLKTSTSSHKKNLVGPTNSIPNRSPQQNCVIVHGGQLLQNKSPNYCNTLNGNILVDTAMNNERVNLLKTSSNQGHNFNRGSLYQTPSHLIMTNTSVSNLLLNTAQNSFPVTESGEDSSNNGRYHSSSITHNVNTSNGQFEQTTLLNGGRAQYNRQTYVLNNNTNIANANECASNRVGGGAQTDNFVSRNHPSNTENCIPPNRAKPAALIQKPQIGRRSFYSMCTVIFGIKCHKYIDGRCASSEICGTSHDLQAPGELQHQIFRLNEMDLIHAYLIMRSSRILFQKYFMCFVNVYACRKQTKNLIGILRDIRLYPDFSIQFLIPLYYALQQCGLDKVAACKKIVNRLLHPSLGPRLLDALVLFIMYNEWGSFMNELRQIAQYKHYKFRQEVFLFMITATLHARNIEMIEQVLHFTTFVPPNSVDWKTSYLLDSMCMIISVMHNRQQMQNASNGVNVS